MSIDPILREQINKGQWKLGVALVLVMMGMVMVLVAFFTSVGLSATIGDYFTNDKAARDAAAAGSAILAQQGVIHTIPAWVKPLAPAGNSTVLLGIGFILWAIVERLRQRGRVLQQVLPLLKRGSKTT